MGNIFHGLTKYLNESQKNKKTKTKHDLLPDRIKEINQKLIDCVIKDARPFGDFSKPGMLDVFKLLIPGYKPQERHTVAKHLSKQYKSYRKYLTEYLSHIKHLALTTDMWKSKHLTHFLG